jgi:hypothetical protein
VACLRRLLGKAATPEARAWLSEQGIVLTKNTTHADVIAQVIVLLGCRGDLAAIRVMLEWLEPKPSQSVHGLGTEPLVFRIIPPPLPDDADFGDNQGV